MSQFHTDLSPTDQWIKSSHWKGEGSSAGPLYKDPPVNSAGVPPSNRILLVCSRWNLSAARRFKDQMKVISATVGLNEEDFPVSLAAFAPAFWGDFFGTQEFLDPAASLTRPRLMISHGEIIDDIYGTRGDKECLGRLREIAKMWEVELRILEQPQTFM